MTATALNLRSPNFKSITVTTPTAGYTAGDMVKVEDTVGVIAETKTVGLDAVLIYQCDKIVVPKTDGSGITFAKGDKVYYDGTAKKVTNVSSGNTLCGRATEAALATDTTAEIDLQGGVAA